MLITGAAGGIGRATTDLLRVNGFFVIGIDRLEGDNGGDRQLRADLSDQAEVDKVLEEIWSTCEGLDLLVNNAAEQFVQPLIHTQPEDWDRVIDTNLRAAYLLVRGAHDLLSRRTGTIVNVASIHALATSPGMAAYVASKGGLVALTRALALEFASEGIRVNAVLPGAIDTPMLAAVWNESIGTSTVLRRVIRWAASGVPRMSPMPSLSWPIRNALHSSPGRRLSSTAEPGRA